MNSTSAVEIVDMREELRNGNRSMFSESFIRKLQDRLEKKEQTVLMLNKRGSFFLCHVPRLWICSSLSEL